LLATAKAQPQAQVNAALLTIQGENTVKTGRSDTSKATEQTGPPFWLASVRRPNPQQGTISWHQAEGLASIKISCQACILLHAEWIFPRLSGIGPTSLREPPWRLPSQPLEALYETLYSRIPSHRPINPTGLYPDIRIPFLVLQLCFLRTHPMFPH
jgi:hypothetical protein